MPSYEHLRLGREESLTDRHRRPGRGVPPPEDPRAFGAALGQRFQQARQVVEDADVGGFDNRRLLKIVLRPGEKGVPAFDLIPGIEIVSQEAESIILAFATEAGLDGFEARLATLARDGQVTRKELLYVIDDVDHWTPDDRKGRALRDQGWPAGQSFVLDIELWPQERREVRDRLLQSFRAWAEQQQIALLDTINQPSLVMVRLRCSRVQADSILHHRDVRTLDLPPRLGVAVEMLVTDVNDFPPVVPPAADAPAIAVLDSGLTTGHPLVGAAVGDALGFVAPLLSPDDSVPNGHGTFVGGLALYGDVAACIEQGQFVPSLRLFSAKVFNDDGNDQTEFVEKAVDEAVRELFDTYGCRVFNFSYGDLNKVYDGRHVRGLAYTLDRLTRELGVLFVVPTGNLTDLPADPHADYPDYLLEDKARLLDPAPALNALTVGGLVRCTATREAQRHRNTIEDRPIALAEQPFPMTRSGPSIGGAIKPDVVEHAGNLAVMRAGRTRHGGLGVVSLNSGFATGPAFAENVGSSYASPIVAHKAAKLLTHLPRASGNQLRAILGAHARWPKASEQLLNPDSRAEGRERLMRLLGYGRVDDHALYRSLDRVVTLLAEDSIVNDKHHFYELPVPDEFWERGRRTREVSVGLAYSPEVRTTRLDYRRSKISFSLVVAAAFEEVSAAFTRGRDEGVPERSNARSISNDSRKASTLQASRWRFRDPLPAGRRLFVVITRQDSAWSASQDEPEPYALTVVLNDQEHANVNLYLRVRAALEARVQLRARARARA